MSDPHAFTQDMSAFRQELEKVAPAERAARFRERAGEGVRWYKLGKIGKQIVVDRLHEVGQVVGLDDDTITAALAEAEKKPFNPDAAKLASPVVAGVTILSSADFVRGFVPPDYLVDRILQKGFTYSLTGVTGAGKTAIAQRIALSVGEARDLGDYQVQGGRVLYFAAENPDDIRMRWIAMSSAFNFDIASIPVHFIDRPLRISETEAALRLAMNAIGAFDLVIVDTSAAFFEGTDENDNVGMGTHARRLRSLSTMPGKPTVLIACHPVKNAAADNLLPRGGGAFVAEMDGNLTATKKEGVVELHWQGKFRGPDFAPIAFKILEIKTAALVDSKGRQIPSVAAQPITAAEQSEIEKGARRDEDALLAAMLKHKGASTAALAESLGWIMATGKPYKSRVQRILKQFAKDKLAKLERGVWTLTTKGITEAKKAETDAALVGSTY